MRRPSMSNIDLQIAEARQALDKLQDDYPVLCQRIAVFQRKIEPTLGTVSYRFRAEGNELLRLSLRVREILLNMRAPLDHVMWALVDSQVPDTERLSFPICKDPKNFGSIAKNLSRWRVPNGAVDIIRDLNDFNKQNGDPVRWLDHLMNDFKHNELVGMSCIVDIHESSVISSFQIKLLEVLDPSLSKEQLLVRCIFGKHEVARFEASLASFGGVGLAVLDKDIEEMTEEEIKAKITEPMPEVWSEDEFLAALEGTTISIKTERELIFLDSVRSKCGGFAIVDTLEAIYELVLRTTLDLRPYCSWG